MVTFKHCSINGQIQPYSQATVHYSNIAYCYGFGVYESLKVRNGVLYFLDQHAERLINSARVIDLTHSFSEEDIKSYIQELANETTETSYNIKALLIGGKDPQIAIFPLAPLFPDKKLYKKGVSMTVREYERLWPNAKTLSMLGSYKAYTQAKAVGCYDALLTDGEGLIREGTRTNVFFVKDKSIYHPPLAKVLLGVTFMTVRHVAEQNGYKLIEKEISIKDVAKYDGGFLTSTSSKILPIASIDGVQYRAIATPILELIQHYNRFLISCKGILEQASS